MYKERDYIPFLGGLFVFGGLIIIPQVWGGFIGLKYEDAVLPALISCAAFGFAFDHTGNFHLRRSIFATIIALAAMIYLSGIDSSRGHFVAGGLLGFALMCSCGWGGILVGRQMNLDLSKHNTPASQMIWTILIFCIVFHIMKTRNEQQKRQFYRNMFSSAPTATPKSHKETRPISQITGQPMLSGAELRQQREKELSQRRADFQFAGTIRQDPGSEPLVIFETRVSNMEIIPPGTPLKMTLSSNETEVIQGEVSVFSPFINPETRTVEVHAIIHTSSGNLTNGTRITGGLAEIAPTP